MNLSWDKLLETAEQYPEMKGYLTTLKKTFGENNIEIENEQCVSVDVRDMIHQLFDIIYDNNPEDEDVREKLRRIMKKRI